MRVLFPEAVALVSAARQGFMRESVSRLPRRVPARPCCRHAASGRPETGRAEALRAVHRGLRARRRAPGRRRTERGRQARDRRRPRRGGLATKRRPRRSQREYVAALDAFERDHLDANVSIKPTGLGLKLGYDLCKRNVEAVIAAAEPTNRFVRIDMEDSSTTDETLRLFRELRAEGMRGSARSSRRRSSERSTDAASLAGASVRLCKGIYVEPRVDPVPRRSTRSGPASSGRW